MKLCQNCHHTPRGICRKHNDSKEWDRKVFEVMENTALILAKCAENDIWRPNPLFAHLRSAGK